MPPACSKAEYQALEEDITAQEAVAFDLKAENLESLGLPVDMEAVRASAHGAIVGAELFAEHLLQREDCARQPLLALEASKPAPNASPASSSHAMAPSTAKFTAIFRQAANGPVCKSACTRAKSNAFSASPPTFAPTSLARHSVLSTSARTAIVTKRFMPDRVVWLTPAGASAADKAC